MLLGWSSRLSMWIKLILSYLILHRDSVMHRTASIFRATKTSKKVDNAIACGSQRRAAGVPQAIRTVMYFSASPQVPAAYRWNCDAVRCVTESFVMMETMRKRTVTTYNTLSSAGWGPLRHSSTMAAPNSTTQLVILHCRHELGQAICCRVNQVYVFSGDL